MLAHIHFLPAVILQISHGGQVDLQGLDGISALRKSSQELLPQTVSSDHCGALLDLLRPVLVWLLLVLLSQLIAQGPMSAMILLRSWGLRESNSTVTQSWQSGFADPLLPPHGSSLWKAAPAWEPLSQSLAEAGWHSIINNLRSLWMSLSTDWRMAGSASYLTLKSAATRWDGALSICRMMRALSTEFGKIWAPRSSMVFK